MVHPDPHGDIPLFADADHRKELRFDGGARFLDLGLGVLIPRLALAKDK